ncbi:MAG: restriction endonuclease subunit S [Kiritimatiellae bacterium]|nr:restriction endonuclease subunit S [Kiritimatiellia bacterium]
MKVLGEYQLPKSWSWATISELVGDAGVFIDGDWVESKDQDPQGGVRLIQLADVGDGVYRDKSNRFLTKAKAKELGCTFLKEGDVLIARMPDPLGRACVFPGDEKPSVTVVDVAIVRSGNGEFDHRWLACFVNAHPFRSAISGLQAGSTRKRISRGNLATIPLPVPPLPEQRRIVAEIEKQFSRLEEGVGALRRVQANLKRYRAAVLKAACEGRLVPTEAEIWKSGSGILPLGSDGKRQDAASTLGEPFESGAELLARIHAERRQNWQGRGKYKEPAAPDTSKLGKLPEGWAWGNVAQLADVGTGATPKRGTARFYDRGTIPWVASAALNNPFVDSANESVTKAALAETNLTLYPPGTLLLAMYGEGKTRGKCSELRISATTNQAIAAIQCSDEIRAYLKLALWRQYEDLRLTASGGVQPNLNLSLVRAIVVPMPPLAEQSRIVAEVERRLSVVEEMEATVEANLQRATRLRQSILQKAFEGKLVASA